MVLYSAHLVSVLERKEQASILSEDVYLIDAASDASAWERADKLMNNLKSVRGNSYTDKQNREYIGIRKVIEVIDIGHAFNHGGDMNDEVLELTYNKMELTPKDINALLARKQIKLEWID